jgi:hypothetical protein
MHTLKLARLSRFRVKAFATLLALMLFAGCAGSGEEGADSAEPSEASKSAGVKYSEGLAGALDRTREEKARGDLNGMTRSMEQYMIDHSGYPEATSCEALSAELRGKSQPGVPGSDPWGTPYQCASSSTGYSITSAGGDGKLGTADDVTVSGG